MGNPKDPDPKRWADIPGKRSLGVDVATPTRGAGTRVGVAIQTALVVWGRVYVY